MCKLSTDVYPQPCSVHYAISAQSALLADGKDHRTNMEWASKGLFSSWSTSEHADNYANKQKGLCRCGSEYVK